MNIQMIPLSKLIPSPANVRKTGTKIGIEELADSIKAHGLLQNLQVQPGPKGKFEVVAGARRLAALKLLAAEKEIGSKTEIGCNVIDSEAATEISLAENIVRLPMHPADQYEAFKELADAGKGLEDIAARFGVTPASVKQRLKLAAVSPKLIEIYRADGMTLDQLMAFAISDDHAAQEAAWFGQPEFNRNPSTIRAILTAQQIAADDPRVLFVGLEAYRAAGGGIIRDLFDEEHEGYLTDPALLDRLAEEKLQEAAASLHAEGWKWIEIVPDFDYESRSRFGRVFPERQPLPAEQQQERDALAKRYDALIDEHGEDPEPEIAAEIEKLSDRIDDLSEGTSAFRPEDIALSGAVISIGGDGKAAIYRGLVRPEDQAALKTGGSGGEGSAKGKLADPANNGLSARLIEDLTAHRTAALRVGLAARPDIALATLVHALALQAFYIGHFGTESCLDLRLTSRTLARSAQGIADSAAVRKLDEMHGEWQAKLPPDPASLFDWLLAQDTADLIKLLAYCTALGIDGVRIKEDRADAPRLIAADRLANAIGLDMAEWWQPTKQTYLSRVSKSLVLAAVRESVSLQAAQNLENLKKDALVDAAEKRLAGTRWLPAIFCGSASKVEEEGQAA